MSRVKCVDDLKGGASALLLNLPEPLRRFARVQNFDRGEMLFRRGDPARSVFFLCSGEIRMVRSGREGEDILLHRARPGEYFAEAAVDSPTYLCDAVAFQASTLAVIPKGQLAALMESDRSFSRQWDSLLMRELRRARATIERLALSSVADRIRHFIFSEGQDSPAPELVLSGSLKDLGRELGVSHEALYRTLAAMQRAGEIDRKGNRLTLKSGSVRRRPRKTGAS
jgi:CRP/FNR family transcriptional regulator, dissimilatory nitrate respiration regulator